MHWKALKLKKSRCVGNANFSRCSGTFEALRHARWTFKNIQLERESARENQLICLFNDYTHLHAVIYFDTRRECKKGHFKSSRWNSSRITQTHTHPQTGMILVHTVVQRMEIKCMWIVYSTFISSFAPRSVRRRWNSARNGQTLYANAVWSVNWPQLSPPSD